MTHLSFLKQKSKNRGYSIKLKIKVNGVKFLEKAYNFTKSTNSNSSIKTHYLNCKTVYIIIFTILVFMTLHCNGIKVVKLDMTSHKKYATFLEYTQINTCCLPFVSILLKQ